MIKLKIDDSSLNYFTSIFKPFSSNYSKEEIILDLSSVYFIDPFGILFLKIYLYELLNRKNEIIIIFSEDESLLNYLVRMNFLEFFMERQEIHFRPEVRNRQLTRSDLQDTLIELQEFVVQNDDEVESVVEQIVHIVSNRIDFYQNIKEGLWLSLSESISNVQLHSQTNRAFVILQSYSNRNIVIGIGDEGIGIKRSLKKIGERLSDEDAIEKALEPLVTSREDRGGYGLTSIKDYVLENNDILGIRSGSGFLYIQNGTIKKGKCSNLKGTQLYLRLSAL